VVEKTFRYAAPRCLTRTLALAVVATVLALDSTDAIAAAPSPHIQLALHHPLREPFGEVAAVADQEAYTSRWRSVSAAIQTDLDVLRACENSRSFCSPAAKRLLAVVDAGRPMQDRARLGMINRAINLSIQATSDVVQHGVPDVWSSPLATFGSGKGDCEDYAIAKFAALLLAGVPPQDLRLVLVRNLRLQEAHAVLAARLGDRWIILDNRRLLLLEDRDVLWQYRPMAAFALELMARTYAQSRAVAP
jgi:predicted transglutaminase-like cysteine proteinase